MNKNSETDLQEQTCESEKALPPRTPYHAAERTSIFGLDINKRFIVVLHDFVMAFFSLPLAGLLLHRTELIAMPNLLMLTGGFAFFATFCFRLVGMYRGIWRYASISDLLNLARGVSLAVILFAPYTVLHATAQGDAYTIPVIQWLTLMLMLGGPRLLYRAWRDGVLMRLLFSSSNKSKKAKGQQSNILMIGAGDAAEMFIRSLTQNRDSNYRVVGLLDPHEDLQRRAIHGVPVLGAPEEFERILSELEGTSKQPQRLIFSEEKGGTDPQDTYLGFLSAKEFARKLDKYGLSVARLPSLTEFKEGLEQGQGALQLRPIAIEDLLGRPQTSLDMDAIQNLIEGHSVLVTGCGGTIGSELTRQIASCNPREIVLLDSGEFNLYSIDYDIRDKFPTHAVYSYICSIRDKEALNRIFKHHKPEIVFHAAALKHVPLVELNPCEGILTNVVGTKNVAQCAREYGAQAMVQISTDKAVNPTNVMGASKRLGEYYAQALDLVKPSKASATRFMTVRFGNVLGSSGSVVPLFKKQLEAGGPLTVTHPDIKRFFMTVREAVGLVLQASAHGLEAEEGRGRIFVLDMGEPMKIADVARQMITLADLKPDIDIKIVFTGLRPGEKLYEELFDRNEKPVATQSTSVMAAIPQPMDIKLLEKTIDNLEVLARKGDEEEIIHTLASVVPGYQKESYDEHSSMDQNKKSMKKL